jgi:hypothetical protein
VSQPRERRQANLIRPPWTDAQVAALNRFQANPRFHPFTCVCGAGNEDPLVATRGGWTHRCGHTQTWALAFMADETAWPDGTAVTLNPAPEPSIVDPTARKLARLERLEQIAGDLVGQLDNLKFASHGWGYGMTYDLAVEALAALRAILEEKP